MENNEKTKKDVLDEKIDKLIKLAENYDVIPGLENLMKTARNVTRPINTHEFIDRIKVFSNNVFYVTLPKVKLVDMAGFKKGDYVKVILVPLNKEEVVVN
jgi:hypothetical protein